MGKSTVVLMADHFVIMKDVLEEIDAEIDRQVYLSRGRDEHAFGMREADMDLPPDYEHHVIITEALWLKIRKAIA